MTRLISNHTKHQNETKTQIKANRSALQKNGIGTHNANFVVIVAVFFICVCVIVCVCVI